MQKGITSRNTDEVNCKHCGKVLHKVEYRKDKYHRNKYYCNMFCYRMARFKKSWDKL